MGVRDLAYRLYAICERKGWAEEAGAYNVLVASWPEIARLASRGERLLVLAPVRRPVPYRERPTRVLPLENLAHETSLS